MLEYDPKRRITAAQVLEHEYFKMEPQPGRNALVPCQPGEPFVNYPTRPVDTTTDFEGTTNMQQSQPVSSGAAIAGNMPGGHVSNRPVPRPMNVGMQRMHQLLANNHQNHQRIKKPFHFFIFILLLPRFLFCCFRSTTHNRFTPLQTHPQRTRFICLGWNYQYEWIYKCKNYSVGKRHSSGKNVKDYQGIIDAAKTSVKAKQLAAQLIPKFFKFFLELSGLALDAHLDLVKAEELGVRLQAIRGLPLFCKDTPENIGKMVDILVQILGSEEFVERDAVHKALMSLLRQDVKASWTALFKHIRGSDEEPNTDDVIREKVINFVRDKVFPIKAELLKPQEEMERHITDLIKNSLEDVTGMEFRMFMDFLKSLSLFGEKAPAERMKELIEIIEGQADLGSPFNVADAGHTDHIDRLISCLLMALPIVIRGASSSKFINFINSYIIPVFDQLPGERKVDLLKNLAEFSPFTTPQDSRQMLPSIVQLLKKYMTWKKTGEEMNFTYVECLLFVMCIALPSKNYWKLHLS